MEILLEAFKKYEDNIKNKINDQAFHSAAVDMRILALTSLFMEKGIITEKEVQGSYEDVLEAVRNNDDFKNEKTSSFEEYLKNYLQL